MISVCRPTRIDSSLANVERRPCHVFHIVERRVDSPNRRYFTVEQRFCRQTFTTATSKTVFPDSSRRLWRRSHHHHCTDVSRQCDENHYGHSIGVLECQSRQNRLARHRFWNDLTLVYCNMILQSVSRI